MALTGAQMKRAVGAVSGADGGQVVGWDQLAAGANDALQRIGARTVTECALFLATMAQESGYFRATKEGGSGQRYAPYVGRTFEQLTWKSNYAAFGVWCKRMGLVSDQNLFVKNPAALGDLKWAWLGGVWYWTDSRSWGRYSSVIDVARQTGSILAVSRAVNVGTPNTDITPNGIQSRTAMFNAFKALGASIVPNAKNAPSPSQQTVQSAPAGTVPGTPDMVLKASNALWNQYKGKFWGQRWPGWKELPWHISYGHWCAGAVGLAFKKATGYDWSKFTAGKNGPASCQALVSGMTRDKYWTEVKYADSKPCDVIFFFHGKTAYHMGLVEFGPTAAGHDLRTIEGNTSDPVVGTVSMSQGGCFAKKTRDDRLYSIRIFRPTFWVSAKKTQTTDPATGAPVEKLEVETPTDVIDVVKVDATDATDITTFGVVDEPTLATNPIDTLNVSDAFLASITETSTTWCSVGAYLNDRPLFENLPIISEESKVTVSRTRTVRREASLVVQPDPYESAHRDIGKILTGNPGLQIRADRGFSWGGYSEAVPVFDGVLSSAKWDWLTGRWMITAQDRMSLVAADNFHTPIASNPACTFVEAIRWFITESDPHAIVVDLTGNREKLPSVIWKDGTASRINAVMEIASAIGAEVFKSPAANVYVIRPVARPGASVKWTTRQGVALVSLAESTDYTGVFNRYVVKSERSDQSTIQGQWAVSDETSPWRFGGPFGRRTETWSTSLLTEREQLEEAARTLVERSIGNRVSIEWTQLINPLMEAGDPLRVMADNQMWEVIVDDFEIPLGSQAVTPAKARSFDAVGVN